MVESCSLDLSDDLNILNDSSNFSLKSNPSEIIAESVPNKPRMTIQSITKQQFSPFSHIFVCITRAFNLVGCSMKSLSIKIRVTPLLPIIETNTVWCIDSEVNFRSGYALDYSKYSSSFNLGEYTPVIEFYRKLPDKVELFGFSLLPLRIVEEAYCAGREITYLYKNQSVDIRQFTTGQIIGYVTITIALGFPEQQKFIDPDQELPSKLNQDDQPTNDKDNGQTKQQAITSLNANISVKQINANEQNIIQTEENEDEEDEDESEIKRERRRRKRHRHHRKANKRSNWTQKAIAYGWKPPGYIDPEWKDKAFEKGWIPPNSFSDIGVSCKPIDCPNMKNAEIQIVESEIIQQNPKPPSNDNESEDSAIELFNLLNAKHNKEQIDSYSSSDPCANICSSSTSSSNLSVQSPECVFSNLPKLRATPNIVLFETYRDLELLDEGNSMSDSSLSSIDVEQSVNKIINQSMHKPIKAQNAKHTDNGSNLVLPPQIANLIFNIDSESDSETQNSDSNLHLTNTNSSKINSNKNNLSSLQKPIKLNNDNLEESKQNLQAKLLLPSISQLLLSSDSDEDLSLSEDPLSNLPPDILQLIRGNEHSDSEKTDKIKKQNKPNPNQNDIASKNKSTFQPFNLDINFDSDSTIDTSLDSSFIPHNEDKHDANNPTNHSNDIDKQILKSLESSNLTSSSILSNITKSDSESDSADDFIAQINNRNDPSFMHIFKIMNES